jgi:two-component system, NarL family, response regulator YdfI
LRPDKLRVLVVAESAIRRAGLEALIRSSASLTLVGAGLRSVPQSGSAREDDIVLMDVDSLDDAVERLSFRQGRVVALVDEPDAASASQALRANVRAILPRDSSAEQIETTIHSVHQGFTVLETATALELASRVAVARPETETSLDELTPRELEVLSLLAEGKVNKEISSALEISEHTVKFHISSILDKLGVATRTEAVTTALRAGLILL